MALATRLLRDKEGNMGSYFPGHRLWLTADKSRLVEDDDPDAATLFCGPRDGISEADAERFGLKAKPPPEDKAVKAPPEDKAAGPTPEAAATGAPKRIVEPQSRRQGKRRRR